MRMTQMHICNLLRDTYNFDCNNIDNLLNSESAGVLNYLSVLNENKNKSKCELFQRLTAQNQNHYSAHHKHCFIIDFSVSRVTIQPTKYKFIHPISINKNNYGWSFEANNETSDNWEILDEREFKQFECEDEYLFDIKQPQTQNSNDHKNRNNNNNSVAFYSQFRFVEHGLNLINIEHGDFFDSDANSFYTRFELFGKLKSEPKSKSDQLQIGNEAQTQSEDNHNHYHYHSNSSFYSSAN